MKGFRSLALQQALNSHGADISEDGEFGQKTRSALQSFQKAVSLEVTGMTNEQTLRALGLNEQVGTVIPSSKPMESYQNTVRVTGCSVHVRTGPNTEFESIIVAQKGNTFKAVDVNGWYPILLNGDVCWISGKYSVLEN